MKFINKFLLAGLCLALSPVLQAEEAAPEVKVTEIKAGLYLLQGRGGNVVASVGDDGVLMVDDDYAELQAAYRSALDELAGEGSIPRYLLNTHWHFDHVGNNAYWGGQGTVILAHTNVRARMSTRQEMKAFDRVVEPSPAPALPVVTYDDSIALHINGLDVEVKHFPRGHTDGDSMVFFPSLNVVHTGDHYFFDRFPFVDLGSGGDVRGYATNVGELLAIIDDQSIVVPGHGPLATKADLQRYHDMLVATTDLIGQWLEEGMPVDAIIERGLGEQWQPWGAGFIDEATWIRTVAASLGG